MTNAKQFPFLKVGDVIRQLKRSPRKSDVRVLVRISKDDYQPCAVVAVRQGAEVVCGGDPGEAFDTVGSIEHRTDAIIVGRDRNVFPFFDKKLEAARKASLERQWRKSALAQAKEQLKAARKELRAQISKQRN